MMKSCAESSATNCVKKGGIFRLIRGENVESVLWAINLVALVFLCFWAIRQEKLEQLNQSSETEN